MSSYILCRESTIKSLFLINAGNIRLTNGSLVSKTFFGGAAAVCKATLIIHEGHPCPPETLRRLRLRVLALPAEINQSEEAASSPSWFFSKLR